MKPSFYFVRLQHPVPVILWVLFACALRAKRGPRVDSLSARENYVRWVVLRDTRKLSLADVSRSLRQRAPGLKVAGVHECRRLDGPLLYRQLDLFSSP